MRRASGDLGVLGVDVSRALGEAFDRALLSPTARGEAKSACRTADEGSLLGVFASMGGEEIEAAGTFLRSFAFTCLRGIPISTDLSTWS